MVLDEDLQVILQQMEQEELDFFNGGTILITGCAGSLALELITFLAKHGNVKKIIGIDNCSLGYPQWLEKEVNDNALSFFKMDISKVDPAQIPGVEEVTHVFHMASIASPVYYRKDPLGTMDANVGACRKLLEYFRNRNLKVFCYFSSSEIYGDPAGGDIPTKETYWGNVSCVGPRACYDESKRYSETLCYVFGKMFKVPYVILRPFNIFGPGMKLNDGRLPTDCANAVMQNCDIVIFSDGTPTRTFCYMSDAITWILKASAQGLFDVFNIGKEGPEMSIREFAELVAEVGREQSGYTGKVVFKTSEDPEYLVHNPSRRCPDLTHAREKLCFTPVFDTREGISRYLKYLSEEAVRA